MNKRVYRFFGGLLLSQQRWLNKMAAQGLRLVRTTKAAYEFEDCRPGQYEYCVEYIGHRSKADVDDYAGFLESCGYRVFFKNINLDYSVGKVELHPWADKGGRVATAATTLHRELLIVEKQKDGKPFQLHTTYEDRIRYYKAMQRPWLFLLGFAAVGMVLVPDPVWVVFGVLALAGAALFAWELYHLKRQADLEEW